MAIYYKFKSAKDYASIVLDGPFITVGTLKQKILEAKYKGKNNGDSKKNNHNSNGLCLGTDLDLEVVNAQTDEEYCEDTMLIPTNTFVLLRRVPGNRWRRPIDTTPIVVGPQKANKVDNNASATKPEDDDEWDCHDFGGDVYAVSVPGVEPVQSKLAADSKANEDERIKALVNTPALEGFCGGADFGTKKSLSGGRSFCRMPPKGYVCHRCNVPGHFIQDCPTNGDPNYDFKRVRHPTGIPKSMLVSDPDGNYKLPGGTCAVLKPNEAAFDREMEGMSSSSSSSRSTITTTIPPELLCSLCKQVMKDAVLTSKCCFQSFCDDCIRSHIINFNLKCVCGATGVLTDHLIPNITLRETIKRILESGSNSSSSGGSGEKATTSAIRVENVESHVSRAVTDSAHKTEQLAPKAADVHESTAQKGPAPSRGSPLAEKKEAQYKPGSTETKKKRKRSSYQDSGSGSYTYMMPIGDYAYNPYWNSMPLGMEHYMDPYADAIPYRYMGY